MKNGPAFQFSSDVVGLSPKAVLPSMHTRPLAVLMLLVSFAFQPLLSQVPNWSWAADPACGPGYQEVLALASDSTGVLYVAGYFSGTVDFDPGPGYQEVSTAFHDKRGYIARYSVASTPQFGWVRTFRSNTWIGRERINSLALDAEGSIYAGGLFAGHTDFDPGSGTALHSAIGGEDGFICKFDSTGEFAWVRIFAGNSTSDIRSVYVSPAGNILCMGVFAGQMDIDPGPDTTLLTSLAGGDVFLAELDRDGRLRWARQLSGVKECLAHGMVVDSSGHIYITGFTADTLDADPGEGAFLLTESGAYVIKLNQLGELEWARRFGSASAAGHAIRVDPEGNAIVAGSFTGAGDFNAGSDTLMLTSKGDHDIFILKLTKEGELHWAKSIGGDKTDRVNSIILDGSSIMIAGAYTREVDFDPGPGETLFQSTLDVAHVSFVLRLDSIGRYQWVLVGSSFSGNQVRALATIPAGRLVAGGIFNGDITFGAWMLGSQWECKWDPTTGGYVAMADNISGRLPSVLKGPVVDASCHGEASGSAFVEGTGGMPPYDYLWSNGSTGNSLTGLIAGFYQVTVTDAMGGSAVGRVRITEPQALKVTLEQVSVAQGVIQVSTSGGTPPYSFLWTSPDGIMYTTEDLDGLQASGTYHLDVSDAKGCTIGFEVLLQDIQTATVDAGGGGPLRIYPNPATNEVSIDSDHMFEYIEILGIDGRSCLRLEYPATNRLDISTLPEGCYQVRATDGQQWYAGRVVKAMR